MSVADTDYEWGIILGQKEGGNQLLDDVRKGNFLNVLQSSQARKILAQFAQQRHDESFSLNKVQLENVTGGMNSVDTLCIAVAALHAFIQANWTGPDLEEELLRPVQLLRRASPDSFPARNLSGNEDQGNADDIFDSALRSASLDYLTLAGEPAYHLCESPFLLVLALQVLNTLPNNLHSRSLWKLRAASIHSRVLDNPVGPPEDVMEEVKSLKVYLTEKRDTAKSLEEAQRWNKLLAITLIDEGLTVQRSGKDREANERFLEAAKADGLQYEITGALGKRTKFQKEDKSILVLLARSSQNGQREVASTEGKDIQGSIEEEEAYDADPIELKGTPSGWKATADKSGATNMPSEMLHNDDTLLERTRFTSTAASTNAESNGTTSSLFTQDDITNPSILNPLDSCILLGLCLNIHNASPENGLTASQMSAFVQRVLAHARNWSVHTMGLLLRSRLEADRTRTVQRSTLQLQALLDQMPTSDSSIVERMQFVHELELPSKWEMQAELARRYAALGVLRSALEIFERIELWQEVVQCWGALGRQDKGIEVLRDLLKGVKDESDHVISAKKNRSQHVQVQLNSARQAKLWCLLGDLEVEKAAEHYTQAWNVSSKRSARAARSLGAVAFAASEFAKATIWLRRALKIQPLYARTWFTLGCVYMRLDTIAGYVEAARCFRRCTALDDEDAESWNNLASCYLRLSQQSEGVLREAQMAEHADAVTDQRAVLSGIEEEEDDDNHSQSDTNSLHSRDSGVAVQSDTESEAETEVGDDDDDSRLRQQMQRSTLSAIGGGGSGQGAFDVKLLAHRALEKSLRFAYDDWRVWNNFMIVSVDCGLMADAVRSLVRVVELCSVSRILPGSDPTSSSNIGDFVDIAVVNRIVDAVIRAPSSEQDAIIEHEDTSSTNVQAPVSKQNNHNPNEGHGLWPIVRNLFEVTLLPKISEMPDLWRAYARLLFWRGRLRSALDAHLTAWRTSYGAEACDLTSQITFVQAIDALTELCELLENFGHREVAIDEDKETDLDIDTAKANPKAKREPAMENWQFRARSLVRTFMGRTRDAFESDPLWERLQELRDSLSPNSRG